ncbi:hypothetical protein [Desmospora activa]|nr:hypothetical protein [Desmospora activa]
MLRTILEAQEVTNAKLEALTSDARHLQGEVAFIKENVASLKESQDKQDELLQQLVQGQERQDRILEALATRSLEQETEIRELKRIK